MKKGVQIIVKRYLFCFIIILLLSGCSDPVGGEVFFNHIDEMEQALDQQEWNMITQYVEDFKKIYKDEQWKLQLLGDEEEYEGLYRSINNLVAAVKEEDSVNLRMELATSRTILEQIYSV